MNLALMLLLSALAAARIHRLFTLDEAGEPVRDRFDAMVNRIRPKRLRQSVVAPRRKYTTATEWRRWRLAESLDKGFYCRWCAAFWYVLAFVATGLAWSDTWPWQLVAGVLSASYVVGILGHLDTDTGDDDD